MREYETIYAIKPDLPPETVKSLQDKISEIIKKQSGHVLINTDWGKRKLAYRVDKFRHAQYFYLQYLDQGAAIAEVERILKYDDKVLKFMTVRREDQVDVQARLAAPPQVPLPPEEYSPGSGQEGRDRYPSDGRRGDRYGGDGREEIPNLDDVPRLTGN